MKHALFILLLTIGYSAQAQQQQISLPSQETDFKPTGFYIAAVADGRTNQQDIGYTRVGIYHTEERVDLLGGLENALYSHLRNSIPADTTLTPVVIKVDQLEVSEKNFTHKDTGKVQIALSFYHISDGQLGKLYDTEITYEELTTNATRTIGSRISKALIMGLERFDESGWQSVNPIYESMDSLRIVKNRRVLKSSYFEMQKSKNRWNNLLTYNKTFGVNADGWGLNYYGYWENGNKKWRFPVVLSIERFTLNTERINFASYEKVEMRYWMPGFTALRRLSNNFYVHLGLLIPIGSETLTSRFGDEEKNSFWGVAASQGLYFIPESPFGITFGVAIYERFLTSEVYREDIGVKLEIGIKL
jgi:hypothetical protein